MGNATWGAKRAELEPGDYLAHIKNVRCDTSEDFKDKTKTRDVFVWEIDLQHPNGNWESRSLYTPRNFTDMSQKPDPKFVSGLNKLVRACGFAVPQSEAEVGAFNEESLISSQFVWRVEEDEETGAKVRKFVPLKGAKKKAAAVAAKPAPVAVAEDDEEDDEDPFSEE